MTVGQFYISPGNMCLALDETGITSIWYLDYCNGYYPGVTNLEVCEVCEPRFFNGNATVGDMLKSFQRNGIIFLQGSVADQDLKTAMEVLLAEQSSRVSKLLTRNEVFAKFLQNPKLKNLLDLLFPEGHHLTTYSSNSVVKGNDKVFWHTDYPYHDIYGIYPDELLGVQVNFALTDFTVDNGATMYVPQSHLRHRFPEPFLDKNCNVEHMVVPKGTIIIYRGDLWHSQGINNTDQVRSVLLANFSPLKVPAKGKIAESVGTN
jgi:hypothetical protein